VRECLSFSAGEIAAPRPAALALLGMLDSDGVPARIEDLLEQAMISYLALARPRAVLEPLGSEEFARIFEGEGQNAARTPVGDIHPRAGCRVLFALTLGKEVSRAISDLFAASDFAAASMLDAVASAAADTACSRLAEHVLGTMRREGAAGGEDCALGYSPGYCGWHLTGQRRLFERLKPEEIGIELNASCLMVPLKSVSGVILAGPAAIHDIVDDYPCCAGCAERACRDRLM
jgi:hypothetical protein